MFQPSSAAEQARAIVAHLNARDRDRAILEVPDYFVGQQEIYEQLHELRREMAVNNKRVSWVYHSARDRADSAVSTGVNKTSYLSTPRLSREPVRGNWLMQVGS